MTDNLIKFHKMIPDLLRIYNQKSSLFFKKVFNYKKSDEKSNYRNKNNIDALNK